MSTGTCRSAGRCWRMRGRTSPTAISMSCCWPRSIARCSGSVPFAWWQLARLAELAEIISDASALEVIEDRLSYAEILLDLAQQVRPGPVGLAMAQGVHGARARRAHPRGCRRPCEARLAQANVDAAAAILPVVIGVRRQHRLRTTAPPPAIDSTADAATAMRKPELGCFLFIGPDLDLRHLPRRRRALRPTQRAAQGCGWLRRATAPIPTRPPTGQITLRRRCNEQPPSELMLEPERPRRCGRSGSPNCRDRASSPTIRAGSTPMSAAYALAPNRVLTVTPRRRPAPCAGDRTAEVRSCGPRRRCLCRHRWRSRDFPARRPGQGHAGPAAGAGCRAHAGAADRRPPGQG